MNTNHTDPTSTSREDSLGANGPLAMLAESPQPVLLCEPAYVDQHGWSADQTAVPNLLAPCPACILSIM